MNLYQINQALSEKMNALGEMLQDGQEPSDDELDEILDLQGDLSKKLTSYGYVIKNLSAEADMIDDEIKRLTALKKAKNRHTEILRERMQGVMAENGIDEIDDPVMPIKLKLNSPSVRIDIDVEHLPSEFIKIKYEADKTALSKALKGGAEIKGVSLERKQSLKIG